MKIIVIGAGIASLTFAVDAIKDGHQIVIIEKNIVPGGVMALYKEQGFSFLQGPLLLDDMNKGQRLYNVLDSIGVHLETFRSDRGLVYGDINLCKRDDYEGPDWRKNELKRLFPDDIKGIEEYYRFYETLMRISYLSNKKDIFSKLETLFLFLQIKKYKDMSCDTFLKKIFKNEELRIVYDGILADFCANPKDVNCFVLPFLNPETAFDDRIPTTNKKGELYYPAFNYIKGGVQQIPEAYAKYIVDNGGEILYNHIVTKIVVEDGIAKGVIIDDDKQIDGDIVVADCGAQELYFDLIGKQYLKQSFIDDLYKMSKMESVFMLHLGVDIDPMKYQKQALVYYYGTSDIVKATEKLRQGIYHQGDDGYLIFVDSYQSEDFAPTGKYALTIYTVAPNYLKDGTWDDKQEEYADKLIKLAEKYIPDLSKHIVFKKIITPAYYRHLTNTNFHSFGGLVPDGKGFLPPHQSPIVNLYHLGSQSFSNASIAPTAEGGHRVYELIKNLTRN